MTDRFNRKAQEILAASEENGGLTRRNLFDLMIASHDESAEVARLLAEKAEVRCDAMDAKFAKLDCIRNPRKPRRNYDEPDVDYRSSREDRRLWVMWNIVTGLIRYLVLPVSVAVIATLVLTGRI